MAKSPDPRDVSTLDRPEGEALALSTGETRALLGDDRYVIGELLGEGGMGVVRLCEDRRTGRQVALKGLRRAGAPEGDVARFVREVRVQAELDHPGVVPVYELGGARAGTYFTMRRVQGITLDEVIHRLRTGDAEAKKTHTRHRLLTAFVRICGTVEYAHARGIIHRDLKPSNVMFGDFGEVYVLDWGLAQVGADEDHGGAMGTPAYMAPEQAAGQPLDARVDVFALGAILFEILALEPLFDDEAVAARMAGRRPVFDTRPSRVAGAGVHAELDAICAKAAAIDVEERFESVLALREAVEAFLAHDEHAARRHELATRHLARARAAAARPDDARCTSRVAALKEIGRALALSPEHAKARAFLGDLLKSPPEVAPAEIAAELDHRSLQRRRVLQVRALITYTLPWVTLYPLTAWLVGVRRPLAAVLVAAAWCAVAVVILIVRARRADDRRISYIAVAMSFAVAMTTLLSGPYMLVPVLAGVTVMGHVLVGSKRQRPSIVLSGCAAIAIPTLLMWFGVSDIATFAGERGVLLRGALETPPHVLYLGVTLVDVVAIVFAGAYALHYRAILELELTQSALFNWQLERLVPPRDAPPAVPSVSGKPAAPAAALATAPTLRRSPQLGHAADGLSVEAADETPPGRYERMARIGKDTWKCHDRQLDRIVAMQALAAGASAEAEERFVASARLRAQLEHPAIAPVYDVAKDEDGAAFFTMKLVQGKSLAEVLEALARQDPETTRAHGLQRLLSTLGQVCLVIAYAHGRGTHHGALDTAKVVLASFGEVYVEGWTAPLRADARADAESADLRALGKILRAILRASPAAIPELEALADETIEVAAEGRARGPRELYEAIEAFLAGDRDAELRRRLAAIHRERAAHALDRLHSGIAEARVSALREIGRVVLLEPSDPKSFELLVRLLTEPPRQPPPAVVAHVDAMRHLRARRAARSAAWFAGLWLLFYPVLAWMIGVHDMAQAVVVFVMWAITVAAFVLGAQRSPRIPWPMISIMASTMVTTVLSGPFMIVPVLASVLAMSFSLVVDHAWRRVPVVLASIAVVVPTVLDWTRIIPVYWFTDGALDVRGALGRTPILVGTMTTTIAHIIIVLFAAAYAARFRDTLDSVAQRNLLNTWQLAKLVPPISARGLSSGVP